MYETSACAITIGQVKGPKTIGHVKGPITIGHIKGPITIGHVKGPITIGHVKCSDDVNQLTEENVIFFFKLFLLSYAQTCNIWLHCIS